MSSSNLTSLLARAAALPGSGPRRLAALLGACAADAAARPLHWVYDVDALAAHLKEKELQDAPEFYPESRSPFYSLDTGDNSCYFDEALSALGALKASEGNKYDYDVLKDAIKADLGPGTRYDMAAREEFTKLTKEGKATGPLIGKWMQGAPLKFLGNVNVRFIKS